MTKQDIQFQIDQLRKDKIIYAVESRAVSTTSLVAIFAFGVNGKLEYAGFIAVGAVMYMGYVLITNFLRLLRIKKLESQL